MTERLTSTHATRAPRWVAWIPPLLLASSLAALLSRPRVPWPVADEPAATLHTAWVQRASVLLGPDLAWLSHLPFALLLVWMCGALTARMLPPKAPSVSRTLARALGMVGATTLLHSWFQHGLGPTPALPATATLLSAWTVFLNATDSGNTRLAAFAGLLAGLAATLDPFTGLGAAPPLVWALASLVRNGSARLRWTLLFILGTAVGAFPGFGRVTHALFRVSEAEPGRALDLLSGWIPVLGIAGLLLVVLALAVGLPQKNRVMAGLLVPTILLQKVASPWVRALGTDRLGIALVPVVILFSYGAFRLARGVESGVHGVNPSKARKVAPVLLLLLLLGFKIWTGFLFAM